MPVGRPDDLADGAPMRAYRGKPQPLGTIAEWICPTCRVTNTTAYENGCPACGTGVSASAGEDVSRRPGMPADWQVKKPQAPRREVPGSPEAVLQEMEATRPATITYRPAPIATNVVTITRIIQYVCKLDQQDALQETLRRSLVGQIEMGWGTITAAVVDDVSNRQQDILEIFRRQPGVWVAHQEGRIPRQEIARREFQDETRLRHAAQSPDPIVTEAARHFAQLRTTVTAPTIPDTGEPFDTQAQEVADGMYALGGASLCYTLSLALQQFATVASEYQERDLVYTEKQCLALANALLGKIPEGWLTPQPPPAPEAP